jgi:hypothetical protein
MTKYIKLSEYAKNKSITYKTAWNHFQSGKLKNAVKDEFGNIYVADDKYNFTSLDISNLRECINDITFFVEKYVKIKNFNGYIDFKPYPKQKEILKSWQDKNKSIILSSRQAGMTTLMCIFAIYESFFNKNSKNTYIITTRHDMKQHIVDILSTILAEFKNNIFQEPYIQTSDSITLNNGSCINVFASTDKRLSYDVCGKTIDCLFLDNPDYHEKFDEYFPALMPAIPKNGRLIMAGTPKYKDEQSILRKYAKDENFHATVFHWSEIPHHDEKWAENMKKILQDDEIFEAEFNIHL